MSLLRPGIEGFARPRGSTPRTEVSARKTYAKRTELWEGRLGETDAKACAQQPVSAPQQPISQALELEAAMAVVLERGRGLQPRVGLRRMRRGPWDEIECAMPPRSAMLMKTVAVGPMRMTAMGLR